MTHQCDKIACTENTFCSSLKNAATRGTSLRWRVFTLYIQQEISQNRHSYTVNVAAPTARSMQGAYGLTIRISFCEYSSEFEGCKSICLSPYRQRTCLCTNKTNCFQIAVFYDERYSSALYFLRCICTLGGLRPLTRISVLLGEAPWPADKPKIRFIHKYGPYIENTLLERLTV